MEDISRVDNFYYDAIGQNKSYNNPWFVMKGFTSWDLILKTLK